MKFKLYHLCCLSTSLFSIPVIYYYQYCIDLYCNINRFLIIQSILFSWLFWRNPIKNNIYHKMDGISAKITYSCVVYNTFIKLYKIYNNKYVYKYLLINILVILLFLISNYFSSKKWCCSKHILFHFIFHIAGVLSTIYTFGY